MVHPLFWPQDYPQLLHILGNGVKFYMLEVEDYVPPVPLRAMKNCLCPTPPQSIARDDLIEPLLLHDGECLASRS
jgi:hypothetical protein